VGRASTSTSLLQATRLILDMYSTLVEQCKDLHAPASSLLESVSLQPCTLPAVERTESSPPSVQVNPWVELSDHCNSVHNNLTGSSAGLLTTYASWRWAFYLQGILTIFFAVAVFFFVPNDPREFTRREPIDWFGALLVSSGLCIFCFALTDAETSSDGWETNYIIVALILGPALIILFIWLQSRLKYPLVPPSIWRYPQFSRVIATYFLGFMTFGGVLIFNYMLEWQLVFHRNALGV
jgi:hypothetical protein